MAVCLWLLGWRLLAADPAWAETEAAAPSIPQELWRRLGEARVLLNDPTVQRYAAYVVGGIVLLWLLGRIPRWLNQDGGGQAVAAPSRSENLREARRAARREIGRAHV